MLKPPSYLDGQNVTRRERLSIEQAVLRLKLLLLGRTEV